jgi:hypothetical protein
MIIRDRCYDFLNIFAEKFSTIIGVFDSNKAKLCKILIITLVFEKNANFFRRKLSKIAEKCDHNIEPRSGWVPIIPKLTNIVWQLFVITHIYNLHLLQTYL